MKKHFTTIIMVISCVATVMCLVRINELQNTVRNYSYRISELESNIRNEINGISYEVESALEQQASLISDSGWDWQNLENADIKNNKIVIDCYVTAKQYNPDTTQAVIYCGEQAYPMTLENGQFVAQLEVPVFTYTYVDRVQFTDNGTVKTEKLDWYINAKDQLVPEFYADAPGYSMTTKDKTVSIKYNGTMMVHVNHRDTEYSKKADFIVKVDGREAVRKTVGLTKEIAKGEHMDVYDVQIEAGVEVPFGSTVETYMEFTDENGFIYRCLMEQLIFSNEDGRAEESIAHGDSADIYAPDGTPLFVNEWQLIY